MRGTLVPQHSVYYIVPNDPSKLDDLATYLNSPESRRWLVAHCQRATKGYLRMQSAILKKLPLPAELAQSTNDLPQRSRTARRSAIHTPASCSRARSLMLTHLVWLGGFNVEASLQVDSLRRVRPETSRGTDAVR